MYRRRGLIERSVDPPLTQPMRRKLLDLVKADGGMSCIAQDWNSRSTVRALHRRGLVVISGLARIELTPLGRWLCLELDQYGRLDPW